TGITVASGTERFRFIGLFTLSFAYLHDTAFSDGSLPSGTTLRSLDVSRAAACLQRPSVAAATNATTKAGTAVKKGQATSASPNALMLLAPVHSAWLVAATASTNAPSAAPSAAW